MEASLHEKPSRSFLLPKLLCPDHADRVQTPVGQNGQPLDYCNDDGPHIHPEVLRFAELVLTEWRDDPTIPLTKEEFVDICYGERARLLPFDCGLGFYKRGWFASKNDGS
jgi:hypothetical protein